MSSIEEINRGRDKVIARQKEGPDGLHYPILSMCCAWALSIRVHSMCLNPHCQCPCHKGEAVSQIKLVQRPNGEVRSYATSADVDGVPIDVAAIELSECPCDPRRRHERLGQKVAVV